MPGPRSSTHPPGVGEWRLTPARASRCAACRAAASAAKAGTRPSGGSVTSDVWRVSATLLPGSNQNWL